MTPEWRSVESVVDLTPQIREFRLRLLTGASPMLPGSYIQVQVPVDSRVETRCYSLVGPLDDGGVYRIIAVEHNIDGRGGSGNVAAGAGSAASISRPKNDFMLSFDWPDYLLIAGGIGITPLLGMAVALKQRGASFRLAYTARQRADLRICWRTRRASWQFVVSGAVSR